MDTIAQYLATPMQTISYLLLAINVILHLFFAGAVAKDAGRFEQQGHKICLVSGVTWAFATLVGGVFVAAIYWFIHHSTLTRA